MENEKDTKKAFANLGLRVPRYEVPTVIEIMDKYDFAIADAKKYIFMVGAELYKRNPEEFFMILKTLYPGLKSE